MPAFRLRSKSYGVTGRGQLRHSYDVALCEVERRRMKVAMQKIFRTYGLEQVSSMASVLRELSDLCNVITFQGPIGAGKTTLIREFLQSLGVPDTIVSPTFTYVSVYKTDMGRVIYHFDLYRIASSTQFEALGFMEYLCESGALVLIEWPEVIASLLPKNHCAVELDYVPEQSKRMIELTLPPGVEYE